MSKPSGPRQWTDAEVKKAIAKWWAKQRNGDPPEITGWSYESEREVMVCLPNNETVWLDREKGTVSDYDPGMYTGG